MQRMKMGKMAMKRMRETRKMTEWTDKISLMMM